ncbi:hypothetical protein BU23DRAFT_637491 [Bimuria novae-zelandiae CBS 107.79]|uniref:Helicase C-terminal domain-containing protein n=1 Tax=Bimuria novae-zelandiae CBS 107.79 TaxID=1447943 RepID=A0A6A5VYE6_9PLEO|nr:hypothetical protein BU23DRAFT_637491 [Bimuria novae-zelandiae CBS 107.79]
MLKKKRHSQDLETSPVQDPRSRKSSIDVAATTGDSERERKKKRLTVSQIVGADLDEEVEALVPGDQQQGFQNDRDNRQFSTMQTFDTPPSTPTANDAHEEDERDASTEESRLPSEALKTDEMDGTDAVPSSRGVSSDSGPYGVPTGNKTRNTNIKSKSKSKTSSNKAKKNVEGLEEVLKKLENKSIRIGTMFSGTESPLIAWKLLLESHKSLLKSHGKSGGRSVQVDHAFSWETDERKQAFIERNFKPLILFSNTQELLNKKLLKSQSPPATTAYGGSVPIPGELDLLIAGFVCEDFSKKNNKKKGIKSGGEGTDTWRALYSYISRFRPKMVLIENVKATKKLWDETMKPWLYVDTKNHYLPQTRERMCMLAIDKRVFGEGSNAAILEKWEAVMEGLQRRCSSPFDAWLMNESDERQEYKDPGRRKKDWTLTKARNDRVRMNQNLGMGRPITKWSETGVVRPLDWANHSFYKSQSPRIWDCIDTGYLQAMKKEFDPSFKMLTWGVAEQLSIWQNVRHGPLYFSIWIYLRDEQTDAFDRASSTAASRKEPSEFVKNWRPRLPARLRIHDFPDAESFHEDISTAPEQLRESFLKTLQYAQLQSECFCMHGMHRVQKGWVIIYKSPKATLQLRIDGTVHCPLRRSLAQPLARGSSQSSLLDVEWKARTPTAHKCQYKVRAQSESTASWGNEAGIPRFKDEEIPLKLTISSDSKHEVEVDELKGIFALLNTCGTLKHALYRKEESGAVPLYMLLDPDPIGPVKADSIQVGINIASLSHRAKGSLDAVLHHEARDKNIKYEWRLYTNHHTVTAGRFPKFTLRSVSDGVGCGKRLRLHYPLDTQQEKSLEWMRNQECGRGLTVTEIEEAIHPELGWRVEAKAETKIMQNINEYSVLLLEKFSDLHQHTFKEFKEANVIILSWKVLQEPEYVRQLAKFSGMPMPNVTQGSTMDRWLDFVVKYILGQIEESQKNEQEEFNARTSELLQNRLDSLDFTQPPPVRLSTGSKKSLPVEVASLPLLKTTAICNLLRSLPVDDQALLFLSNEETIAIMERILEEQSILCTSLSEKTTDKSAVLEAFKSSADSTTKPKVLLLNLRGDEAAGAKLINANHVIFAAPLLAKDQDDYETRMTQAVARCKGIGSRRWVSKMLGSPEMGGWGKVKKEDKKEKSRMVKAAKGAALVPVSWLSDKEWKKIVGLVDDERLTSLINFSERFEKGEEEVDN